MSRPVTLPADNDSAMVSSTSGAIAIDGGSASRSRSGSSSHCGTPKLALATPEVPALGQPPLEFPEAGHQRSAETASPGKPPEMPGGTSTLCLVAPAPWSTHGPIVAVPVAGACPGSPLRPAHVPDGSAGTSGAGSPGGARGPGTVPSPGLGGVRAGAPLAPWAPLTSAQPIRVQRGGESMRRACSVGGLAADGASCAESAAEPPRSRTSLAGGSPWRGARIAARDPPRASPLRGCTWATARASSASTLPLTNVDAVLAQPRPCKPSLGCALGCAPGCALGSALGSPGHRLSRELAPCPVAAVPQALTAVVAIADGFLPDIPTPPPGRVRNVLPNGLPGELKLTATLAMPV